MRLRKVKNIEEKIKKYDDIIIFDALNYKGKWNILFNNNNPIYLEIGMGKGKFILEHARRNPNINYIGCELSDSVIYKAAERFDKVREKENINNLLMINKDASILNEIFENEEIEIIYLNFSDPWPKSRHAKRRLTSPNFLKVYKELLGKDGIIEMKTDNRHLFEYSLEMFNEEEFSFLDLSLDLHEDKEDIITTEYEDRFTKLNQPIYYVKTREK